MSNVHELKTWPPHFEHVRLGAKRFEVRSTLDREFAIGDVLVLREWDPATKAHTGRTCSVVVTHMLEGPAFGIPEGVCIMSIALRRERDGGAA